MWTIERVKEELPDIQVLVKNKIVRGILRGRMNRFVTVHTDCDRQLEASWETIVTCLNSGCPIIY